uniref:60 ribosomal protein L14 n=1 Tax=Zea mays TaxID=4577 RepID=B6SRH3_MAIZE|nr:60 ribosomal protein L14 [Zea mays]
MSSPFRRFVQIGRVALINYGPDVGKLCVIIDVVDSNRALIDGPESVTGVKRQAIHFKRLSLTDHVVKVPRNARQTLLTKAVTTADVKTKFANSAWGKKLAAKQARANTSDFDRFKITVLKKRRNHLVAAETRKLVKAANKKK